MNEIVNKFLLTEDKYMPEMHLKEFGFTYSASGTFTKDKQRIKKIQKQETQVIFTEMKQIKLVST